MRWRTRCNRGTSPARRSTFSPPNRRASTQEFQSPLRGMDNVLLTPHIGGSTEEAQENIGIEVSQQADQVQQQRVHAGRRQLSRSLAAGVSRASTACCTYTAISPACSPPSTRSFPRTPSTSRPSTCRPTPASGYVVIDVETDERAETVSIRRKLEQVPGTIRTRILYYEDTSTQRRRERGDKRRENSQVSSLRNPSGTGIACRDLTCFSGVFSALISALSAPLR